MKRLLKPLGLIFCLGVIVSCSKKVDSGTIEGAIVNPYADFNPVVDSADVFTYTFQNLSKNYKAIEWRFGDDSLSTETSPTHTYAAVGDYQATLKVTSSTGTVSRKIVNVNLTPANLLHITIEPTGVTNQSKFVLHIKSHIASAKWTFNEVSPAKTTTTTYTDITPVITQTPGDFNNFTVTITTDKGSNITLSGNCSTKGFATDITATRINYTYNLDNTGNGNENAPKLIDGNLGTKFGYYASFPEPLKYAIQFPGPVTVTLYGIENGNDSGSSRDPMEWYIEGANDNNDASYVVLDHIILTKGFFDMAKALGLSDSQSYYKFWYYPIANPQPFSWYRWRVVKTTGAFQIEEFKLFQ
ncbi:MAG: domain containing protein [Mucilaginibacter sp.]|nr:domain containing protein [Mucilaginibacter sp.]